MKPFPILTLRVLLCIFCSNCCTLGAVYAGIPVLYHASFETFDFLDDDILEHANWRTIESRKLELVDGRFGKALRLGSIPEPYDLGNASSIGMNMYNLLIRERNNRGPNWCGPFIWCGDKVNLSEGSVSFWIKGKLTPQWKLLYLTTSSFGRVERDLIVIRLDRHGCLSAYIVDARYDRHEIVSERLVEGDDWKHIALAWDMSSGMRLYLNGEEVASNDGNDAWWETLAPGILHLPSGGCTYDELLITNRSLTGDEIRGLYTTNTLPPEIPAKRTEYPGASGRLMEKSGVSTALNLPVAMPSDGESTLLFEEVWTDDVGDGFVPGWWVNDGRYVLAWPHPYAFWTITIGDMDYHAEKVDLRIPPGRTVNYVTVEGNLEGVKVLALDDSAGTSTKTLLEVPGDHGFFYGSLVPQTAGKTLRIPFVKEWGTPYHYKGGLNLPLTGDTRIHEVGLFNVRMDSPRPGRTLYIHHDDPGIDRERYEFAMNSIIHRRDTTMMIASAHHPEDKGLNYRTGEYKRINVFSPPWEETGGIASLRLDLYIRTRGAEDVLLVRLRDPAVPSTLWTHAEVKLSGFSGKTPRLLSLTLDMADLVIAEGDRLWLDVCSAHGTDILIGDRKIPSTLTLETIPVNRALAEYSPKALYTAAGEFSASQEYPLWVGDVDADYLHPKVWSGIFDKVYPVQAVRRVDPGNIMASYLWDFASGKYYNMTLRDTSLVAWKDIEIPEDVPPWAAWMREYLKLRNDVGNWWADHQNPDGQFGGGWNDDTTHLIFGMIDIMLDGNTRVLDAVNRCREGLDRTRMFEDGFMQLYPMDRHHTRDPVRAMHNVVLVNLGSPRWFEQAMEVGWHAGHPERTPIHYSEGIPFEAAATAVRWYWGLDQPVEPYIGPYEKKATGDLRYWCSYYDSTLFWYNTAGYKELGGSIVIGSYEFYDFFLGAGKQSYPHQTLSVSWPKGGGPEVARRVEYAGNKSLKAHFFSFDDRERELTVRLYRLESGRYTVMLAPDRDGDGSPDGSPQGKTVDIRRFSDIDLRLPPRTPLVLHITQVERYDVPGPLPDLAIDPGDIRVSNTYVTVTVHNIGNAPAQNVKVTLLADGRLIGTQTATFIDAPVDFVKKFYALQFPFKSGGERIEAVIDPDGGIDEIVEWNNRATAADCRGDEYFDWSDIPYVP